ncbi:MAG: M67 family metallopeptidase [Myxococcales bacterium]|nr:M67 family metallopeptidase [Myxococcales bacterium]
MTSTNPIPPGDWRERAAVLVDPEGGRATLPVELLNELFSHARECYPDECCGILTGPAGGEAVEQTRCTNVQDLRHSEGESELDAGHGFWIDERELLPALQRARARGHDLLTVYHSHIDTEVYLSREDLRGALGDDGTPLWPGVGQVVISVQQGEVRGAGLFEWDEAVGGFRGRALYPRG